MKIFIAGLATETNTFSPIPTGRASFEETFLTRTATSEEPNLFSAPMHVWRKRAEERGWQVVESLAAFAQPAGPTIRADYEGLRDEILADLQGAMPVDIVLLSMHGAMIAQGYDDCEGDLMQRAREIVGNDAVIGLEIDPHNHLTELMLETANLIICYKEYPHTDAPDRAEELFRLAADTAEGKIHPVMRDYDCRMINPYQTPKEPMRSYVDAMMAREGKDGILSLSLAHGFPWADHPRVGTRALAITDGDAELATTTAREIGKRLWDIREEVRADYPSMDAALTRAIEANAYPVVLADYADNAGGGAPSDSTFLLREVLARGIKDVAYGIFWDPVVVRMCQEAGEGAVMPIRLGGKVGPMSGDPIDLTVTVRKCASGLSQHIGTSSMSMGNVVWLEADGVHLIVNDLRTQCFNTEAFTQMGLDLGEMKIVIVKSSQHFYDSFARIASEVIHVATPGAITPDFVNIPYTRRSGDYWPKVENPFQ